MQLSATQECNVIHMSQLILLQKKMTFYIDFAVKYNAWNVKFYSSLRMEKL